MADLPPQGTTVKHGKAHPTRKSQRQSEKEQPAFEVGSAALAFHGPHLYKAKILQCQQGEATGTEMFFVHYYGWSKAWDEWVDHQQLLPINPETTAYQKKLAAAAKKQGGTRRSVPRLVSQGGGTAQYVDEDGDVPMQDAVAAKGREGAPAEALQADKKKTRSKRTRVPRVASNESDSDVGGDACQAYHRRLRRDDGSERAQARECHFKLPVRLRESLVEQDVAIRPGKRNVELPKAPELTVAGILSEWVGKQSKGSPQNAKLMSETAFALTQYFDFMLYHKLLFPYEFRQASLLQEAHPGKPASQIYGGEHLARMLLKLPAVLSVDGWGTAGHRKEFKQRAAKLAQFLGRNFRRLIDGPDQWTLLLEEDRELCEQVDLEDIRTHAL